MAYQIKTVSRLTGIPRNTLLAWERRYNLVEPGRADNGYREYSDHDIATLSAVKQLLDQGYRISEAARLVHESVDDATSEARPNTAHIALLHTTFGEQLRAAGPVGAALSVVLEATSLDALIATPPGDSVDVLVVDLDLLGGDIRAGLRAAASSTGANQVLVLYHFATNTAVQTLVAEGASLIRQPTRVAQVVQSVSSLVSLEEALRRRAEERPDLALVSGGPKLAPGTGIELEDGVPVRRFDDHQLARLREMRSAVACECPNHLSSLASALLAFEDYSATCEDRSERDAALHRYLRQHTGRARRIIEDMLWELCEQERIAL